MNESSTYENAENAEFASAKNLAEYHHYESDTLTRHGERMKTEKHGKTVTSNKLKVTRQTLRIWHADLRRFRPGEQVDRWSQIFKVLRIRYTEGHGCLSL
jgi:hypothetical protein